MGVFEVTQKQYELVMGNNPSCLTGDTLPVEQVSWVMIPDSFGWGYTESTFLGEIQKRTGMTFDLPSVSQWEYACRAGTKSWYNNGSDFEKDLKLLARYEGNVFDGKGGYSRYHTTVGSYQPNAWGLYDMHGNVWEWCLDWDGAMTYGKDPPGPSSGRKRVRSCGCWNYGAEYCASHKLGAYHPSDAYHFDGGFRLAKSLPE